MGACEKSRGISSDTALSGTRDPAEEIFFIPAAEPCPEETVDILFGVGYNQAQRGELIRVEKADNLTL